MFQCGFWVPMITRRPDYLHLIVDVRQQEIGIAKTIPKIEGVLGLKTGIKLGHDEYQSRKAFRGGANDYS